MPYIKKIEAQDKKIQIIAAYNANGNWKELADTLNVSKRTAYYWIQTGKKEDKRGGFRGCKILDIHKEYFVEQVELNPRITLGTLQTLVLAKFNLSVSVESIRRHLDGLCYSLKDLRFEPENGNSPINKQKRKEFIHSLLEFQSNGLPILFMDETNFNVHISRKEGRSLKGTRATTVAAGSRGANVHVIGCISTMGLVHLEIKRGSHKKVDAYNWVKYCLTKAKEMFKSPVVLVIDNAPVHSGLEEIVLDPEFSDSHILRLGPYSPMLNPIESVWSVFKADVKRVFAEKNKDMLMGIGQGTLSCTEFRLRTLETIVSGSVPIITPVLCNNVIARIQSLIPAVLNLENMHY